MIFGADAIHWANIWPFTGCTQLCSRCCHNHVLDILLVGIPLFCNYSIHPGIRVGIIIGSLFDTLQSASFRNPKNLWIWTLQLNHRAARVPTPRPTIVGLWNQSPHKATLSIRSQPRNRQKSVSLSPLGTLTRIRSNLIDTRCSCINITHRHQLRTMRPNTTIIHSHLALIHILNHNSTLGTNKFWRGPGRSNRIIHIKLSHIQQTTLWQRTTVRNLQRS
mmetsp:Transcript_4563/g.6673  ORF Transcript_4563/g.6673 Transcript_4563/m.6673 type:complete len:220 (-) Transcript_4563:115-774(-)